MRGTVLLNMRLTELWTPCSRSTLQAGFPQLACFRVFCALRCFALRVARTRALKSTRLGKGTAELASIDLVSVSVHKVPGLWSTACPGTLAEGGGHRRAAQCRIKPPQPTFRPQPALGPQSGSVQPPNAQPHFWRAVRARVSAVGAGEVSLPDFN